MSVLQQTSLMYSIIILLLTGEIHSENSRPLEDLLLISDSASIRIFDTLGTQRELIATSGSTSVDYNCSSGDLLWVGDLKPDIHILRSGMSASDSLVHKAETWVPISIAVDSVTDKIYVADRSSETVSLYDVVSGTSTVIVSSNLTGVCGVEIDLKEGYLFVQDDYKIIRTDLDGANLRIIYAKSNILTRSNRSSGASLSNSLDSKPLLITGMTVDPQTKRIYWADGITSEVVSINYQGGGRKVHLQIASNRRYRPFGSVTLLDGFLYWAAGREQVFKIDLRRKSYSQFYVNNILAHFIKAFSCSKQLPITNPCKNNNGNCQHLCVMSKSSRKNFKCVCNVGYELADDNKSCNRVQEYLIFSMESKLRGLSITNSKKPSVNVMDPAAINLSSRVNIDINAKDGVVYYVGTFLDNQLKQVRLNDGFKKTLSSNLRRTVHTKLAFDWASRNLYYFGLHRSGLTTINVLNVDHSNYIKVIVEDLQNADLADIVVHPNQGYLYFSRIINDNSKIRRVNLDGSNPTVIYQVCRKHVQAITLDLESERLYWSEISFDDLETGRARTELRHSNLAGGDIRQVLLPNNHQMNLKSIVIHGEFLYGISADKSVMRLKKSGNLGQVLTLADTTMNPLSTNLRVFSRAIQTPRADHPCAHVNICQKFCFAVPRENGGIRRVCSCPHGQRLSLNGRTCIDENSWERNLLNRSSSTRHPLRYINWDVETTCTAAPAA